MRKLQLLSVITLMVMTFFFVQSCKKDDEKSDNLSDDIHKLIPDATLDIMRKMGVPINEGSTPPVLSSTYLMSPFILDTSNIDYDYPGKSFADCYVQFYDQNSTNMSIKLKYENGPEKASGIAGFISGSDNKFTVFGKFVTYVYEDSADIALVVSGTKTANGFNDGYWAIFMIDNHGNPSEYFIENNQGRLIYDSDGVSPTSAHVINAILNENKLKYFGKSMSAK